MEEKKCLQFHDKSYINNPRKTTLFKKKMKKMRHFDCKFTQLIKKNCFILHYEILHLVIDDKLSKRRQKQSDLKQSNLDT